MALDTRSSFYLPFEITVSNRNMNFDEGGSELTAQLEVGSYTLSELPTLIKTAFDAAGGDEYTITVDRTTRVITIASDGATLNLLTNTGSQVGTSPWSLFGFDTTADQTGATSYDGDDGAGSVYKPQFWLQDYIAPGQYIEKADASVNEASDGETIETVSYGDRQYIEFSLKFITSEAEYCDGNIIECNSTGYEDAKTFMQAIIKKSKFEFMPDRDTPGTFYKVILESTPTNRDGTGYRFVELLDRNLRDIYEIDNLRLRVVS